MGIEDVGVSLLLGRALNLRPSVAKVGDCLVARSDWKAQIFNLGSSSRSVMVDPGQRILRFRLRRFWFFVTARRIEFDWIASIDYSYDDVSPSIRSWGAYQEADLYTVALQLKNGERIVLFRFFGEGDFVNNSIWPDWMYWSDQLVANYTKGDQERESMLFVDLLSRMLGVPVSKD